VFFDLLTIYKAGAIRRKSIFFCVVCVLMGRLEAVSGNARKMSAYFQSLFFYLGIVFYRKSITFDLAKSIWCMIIKSKFINNKPGESLGNLTSFTGLISQRLAVFYFKNHAKSIQNTNQKAA